MKADAPHVVVIGGGFAGLSCAKVLARAGVRVTVIDRRNHHLFQPLLYQVATAALSPAQIAAPIRKVLSRWKNAGVLLADVRGFDLDRRRVLIDGGEVEYDYLVVAAGATHSYFGHEEWAERAPGLKTIDDAVTIRRRFLLAFEEAEREQDAEKRRAELTFVIVGAGPTGVELAGAMVEIARTIIPRDFRAIDTKSARVVLVEAGERVLPAFPDALSRRALRDLEELGVEVRLGWRVVGMDGGGVEIERSAAGEREDTEMKTSRWHERIAARNVVWAAGVSASPLGRMLGEVDRSGRVVVEPDLSVKGRPEVFVLGDLAAVKDAKGEWVPGIAPAAMQMGRFVGRLLARRAKGRRDEDISVARFVYRDKGTLATIGRARAVAALPFGVVKGFVAWVLWALVHVAFLISFRTRLMVMIDWAWSYFFFERGARLITGEERPRR
ncbi:MAG TPA: NAD(P)/FAD-dependent oxidoreductase [Phycisphaerales bacterium]|nr:NAD(P)/FAD-dependent oxidoreductase [Phycisphaerales bacterium]